MMSALHRVLRGCAPTGRLALALALLGMLLLLGTARSALADETKVHLESASLEKLPELKTYVTVLGEDNRPIKTKSGFKLLMDSVEQKELVVKATPFVESKEPIDVIVVVQVSAVMESALKDVKRGIEKLAKSLAKNPDSRLALVSYATEPKKLEQLGRPNEVARELDKLAIDPDASEVKMVEAARLAIDLVREQKDRRKLLILFSDGIDAMQSKDAYESVGKRAHDAGVVVDTIGYGPFEPGRLRSLIDISKLGSGTSRGVKNTREIVDRFSEIIEEIQGSYVITFGLTQSGDNQPHVFQVNYRQGKEDIASETLSLQLPVFEPAEPAGWPWWYWLLIVGGGVLLLLIILAIIGSRMQST